MKTELLTMIPHSSDPQSTHLHAYQHALAQWQGFHSTALIPEAAERLRSCERFPVAALAEVLRPLPVRERRPVAFGVFLRAAANWRPLDQALFLAEFLLAPSTTERRLLEAAAKGALRPLRRLSHTLEEFPSRIWKRALATGNPARLVTAAHQAVRAMTDLHTHHEDDTCLEDLMPFDLPSGDYPPFFDLLALTPKGSPDCKKRVHRRMGDAILANRLRMYRYDITGMNSWLLSNGKDHEEHVAAIIKEAGMCGILCSRKISAKIEFMTRRTGKLLFRIGQRGIARQCARMIGVTPLDLRWHHQTITAAAHQRIRQAILRSHSDTSEWLVDPALACSAMSIPLWLMDGVARPNELMSLFLRAAECPWVFPRLQHLYQWHLALAGKTEVLRAIEESFPELSLGLSWPMSEELSITESKWS